MNRQDDFFMLAPFVWFTGVVEARNDPAMLGRVRVRIFGIHSMDKNEIPTETLPWATVMMPVTETAMSGLGLSLHSLVEGTWVIGFFRDSASCQDPIVMGALLSNSPPKWTGIMTAPNPTDAAVAVQIPSNQPGPNSVTPVTNMVTSLNQSRMKDIFDAVKLALEAKEIAQQIKLSIEELEELSASLIPTIVSIVEQEVEKEFVAITTEAKNKILTDVERVTDAALKVVFA